MITVQKFSELVQTQLNAIAVQLQKNFTFKIYPNEGEYYDAIQSNQRELPKNIVFGVMSFMPTPTIPLQNLGIYNVSAYIEILAPVTKGKLSNDDDYGHINDVANVIQNFYAQQTGLTGTLTDANQDEYSYIFSCNTPNTGTEINGRFGRAVPITIMLGWQLIKNGVLYNDINITIGGEPAVCTDFSFENVINPQTDNVDNRPYLESYAQSQALVISVIMPYRKTEVCSSLVNQIFSNSLGTNYNVTYSDGVIDNKTRIMFATNIKLTGQPGLNCAIQATFMLSR
jgi:hypothetical protein